MYQVSNEFNTAVSSTLRELKGRVHIGEDVFEQELQTIKLSYTSNLSSSIIGNVISCSSGIVLNNKDNTISLLKGDDISFDIGLLVNGEVEYVPFQPMFVDDIQESGTKVLAVTGFDKMQKFNGVSFSDIHITYPITVRDFLTTICSAVGLNISTKAFYNDNTIIETQPNFSGTEALREVLSHLSAFCLGNTVINRSGEVEVISISALDQPVTTITPNEYMSLSVKDVYGQINTVVLSRTPQEDNIYRSDDESVAQNGMKELRIANNAFFDLNRDLYIDGVFEKINGLFYFPIELEWRGNPAIGCGDRVTIINTDGCQIETYTFSQTIEFNGGLKANVNVECPNETSTNFKKATNLKERIKNTEIIVDKVNGEIKSIVENTYTKDEVDSNLSTQLTQTSNQFEFKVTEAIKNLEDTTNEQLDQIKSKDTLINTIVTIDNNGIKVGKSDSEFETLMSDTGLYLSGRDNNVIAQFTNEGVKTKNIAVENEIEFANLRIMKAQVNGANRSHFHFIG